MPRVDIRGVMIPNDYAEFYEYFGEEYTCPNTVSSVLDAMNDGEDLEVYINSGGGVIDVGSEIYTMLRGASSRINVKIYITGEACSAASIVAMAGHCEMSPTALMMVHCVSTYAGGNHNDFEHTAEMLKTADEALCTAYTEKTGMTKDEALGMMEHETWLTAEQAKEKGLIDAIMFENNPMVMTNAVGFKLPTREQLESVKKLMKKDNTDSRKDELNARLNLLKLNNRRK